MKCTHPDCDRELEPRVIVHAVRHLTIDVVIEGVPAEVCPGCGDARLASDTLAGIESLLTGSRRGKSAAPGSAPRRLRYRA